MKKLILLSTIFSLFATKLVAQENPAPASTSTPTSTQEASDSSKSKKEKREQRYENASPEKREKRFSGPAVFARQSQAGPGPRTFRHRPHRSAPRTRTCR